MNKVVTIQTWVNEDTHQHHCRILTVEKQSFEPVIEKTGSSEALAINHAMLELNSRLLEEVL